jgi:hypothetical protein
MRQILAGPQGRSSSLRCGRSTLTPTAVHRMGIGPERGKPRETTSGSQPSRGSPTQIRIKAASGAAHTHAGPAALGGAAGPVHRGEAAAARTAARRSGLGCGAPITGELAGITEEAMRESSGVIRNAKRASRGATGHRKGRLHRAINKLETIIERAGTDDRTDHHPHRTRATRSDRRPRLRPGLGGMRPARTRRPQ